jgi:hypothetical protein
MGQLVAVGHRVELHSGRRRRVQGPREVIRHFDHPRLDVDLDLGRDEQTRGGLAPEQARGRKPLACSMTDSAQLAASISA